MMIRARVWALASAIATTTLIATPGPELIQTAEAASKPTVALGAIQGKNSKAVRGWVIDSLKKGYVVTDAEEVIPKAGSDAAYAKSAKSLGSDWIVTGKIDAKKLVLTVRSASDGKVVDTVEVPGTGAKLKRAVAKGVPSGLASVISDEEEVEEEEEEEEAPPKKAAKPAPTSEDEEEATDEEAEESSEEEVASEEEEEEAPAEEEEAEGADAGGEASKYPWAVLSAGLEAARRDFTYNDQLSDYYPFMPDGMGGGTGARQLSDYHLPMQPGGWIGLELYPIAAFSDGFASNIGLTFDYHQMLVTKSSYTRDDEKAEFDNKSSRWSAGLRVRFPSDSLEFGVTAAYGVHKFFLEGDETSPIIPDVKYGYVKLGADGAAIFGNVAVGAKLGVRLLGALGELESLWFPGATGTGVEVGIFGRYALSDQLGIVAGVDMVRYGFDFNAIPKNNVVAAGGAIDQYLIGHLGLRFVLSGGAAAAADGASVSASTDDSESDDAASDDAEADAEEEETEEEE